MRSEFKKQIFYLRKDETVQSSYLIWCNSYVSNFFYFWTLPISHQQLIGLL